MSTPRLPDRHVVITGAAGGLGPVAAATAVREGAAVTLVDTSAERLVAVVDALPASSVRGTAVVDLLDPDAAATFAAGLADVDVVWHLVGGWRGGTAFEEAPLEDWSLLHDLAVRTTVHVARAFTPALLASAHGRFVSVSAPVTAHPSGSGAAYAAMKAASDTVVLALADRLEESQATANVVVVSSILTPAAREADPGKAGGTAVLAEDLAEALVFVSSDVARTMNGQRLRLVGSGA